MARRPPCFSSCLDESYCSHLNGQIVVAILALIELVIEST